MKKSLISIAIMSFAAIASAQSYSLQTDGRIQSGTATHASVTGMGSSNSVASGTAAASATGAIAANAIPGGMSFGITGTSVTSGSALAFNVSTGAGVGSASSGGWADARSFGGAEYGIAGTPGTPGVAGVEGVVGVAGSAYVPAVNPTEGYYTGGDCGHSGSKCKPSDKKDDDGKDRTWVPGTTGSPAIAAVAAVIAVEAIPAIPAIPAIGGTHLIAAGSTDSGMSDPVRNGVDFGVTAGTSQDGFAGASSEGAFTIAGSSTKLPITGGFVLTNSVSSTQDNQSTASAGAVTFTEGTPAGQSAAARWANGGTVTNATGSFVDSVVSTGPAPL